MEANPSHEELLSLLLLIPRHHFRSFLFSLISSFFYTLLFHAHSVDRRISSPKAFISNETVISTHSEHKRCSIVSSYKGLRLLLLARTASPIQDDFPSETKLLMKYCLFWFVAVLWWLGTMNWRGRRVISVHLFQRQEMRMNSRLWRWLTPALRVCGLPFAIRAYSHLAMREARKCPFRTIGMTGAAYRRYLFREKELKELGQGWR